MDRALFGSQRTCSYSPDSSTRPGYLRRSGEPVGTAATYQAWRVHPQMEVDGLHRLCSIGALFLNDLFCEKSHGSQRIFTFSYSRLYRGDHTTRRSFGDFREQGFPLENQGQAQKSRKILRVPIRKGLRARIYLCILRFVGTISCERKVRVDGVRLTATKPAARVMQCLGRRWSSPLASPPVGVLREEMGVGVAWFRGSSVRSDISRSPVRGGYQR